MKRLVMLVMVLGLVLFSGVAFGADTNIVNVSATVVGTCKFLSATSNLEFGSLDPSSGSDGTASTTVQFWCTKNASYTITDDDGLYAKEKDKNRMKHTTDDEYIPYSFSYNPASGQGQGRTNPITLTISGSVSYDNYKNAAAGNYSDTVTLTINP
ncbi:MAG: Csu type fimbrial protein [Thermodesulfobacteriota bacterium]